MRYHQIIKEAKSINTKQVAMLCQLWLDGGSGMTSSNFKAILTSEVALDCKGTTATVIYRGIAPVKRRCMELVNNGKLVFASKRPIVAYSTNQHSAQAAADFTKSGDELTLVFQKNIHPADVLLDFTKLLSKLGGLGFTFSHTDDNAEYELWLNSGNKYYSTFEQSELVYTDEQYNDLLASAKPKDQKTGTRSYSLRFYYDAISKDEIGNLTVGAYLVQAKSNNTVLIDLITDAKFSRLGIASISLVKNPWKDLIVEQVIAKSSEILTGIQSCMSRGADYLFELEIVVEI